MKTISTLESLIKKNEVKIKNSCDPVERAVLSDQIKEYRKQIHSMKYPVDDDSITLSTNIDAPIVGDRENNGHVEPTRMNTISSVDNSIFRIRL